MNRFSAGAIAIAVATWSAAASAQSISMGNPFSFRSDRTANPLGLFESSIVIGVNNVTPNPVTNPGPADGTLTTVIARQAGTEVTLNRINALAGSGLENTYIRQIAYDPNLTGQWAVTASNPTASPVPELTRNTIAFGNVAAVPFVSSMMLTGTGLDIDLSWTQPDSGRVDRQSIFVFEEQANGSYRAIFTQELGTTARAFDLSTIPTLTLGRTYVVSIDTSDLIAGATVASSASYFSFRPTNQVLDAFLPSISADAPDVYTFNVDTVEPDEVIFIDPEVAVGYDFAIGQGDPNFASVTLPDIGDGLYDLFLFDSMGMPVLEQANVVAGQQFAFAPGGVDRFRVLGIEESAMLQPDDPLAFRAGISFVARGPFTGSMTAITRNIDVPAPATLALLGIGLIGGVLRRTARGRG